MIEHNPESITYNIERGVPSQHLTVLRLILPVGRKQYVFIDTAVENCLRKTAIPLITDKLGNLYIKDEDVKEFIKTEMRGKDIKLHPYWTI